MYDLMKQWCSVDCVASGKRLPGGWYHKLLSYLD